MKNIFKIVLISIILSLIISNIYFINKYNKQFEATHDNYKRSIQYIRTHLNTANLLLNNIAESDSINSKDLKYLYETSFEMYSVAEYITILNIYFNSSGNNKKDDLFGWGWTETALFFKDYSDRINYWAESIEHNRAATIPTKEDVVNLSKDIEKLTKMFNVGGKPNTREYIDEIHIDDMSYKKFKELVDEFYESSYLKKLNENY